jgi:hypothetical protein
VREVQNHMALAQRVASEQALLIAGEIDLILANPVESIHAGHCPILLPAPIPTPVRTPPIDTQRCAYSCPV